MYIRFGWFTEIAGAVMVLFTGVILAQDIAARYRLSWAMESRMETVSRMLDVQRAYYPELLEREEKVETARHDLDGHVHDNCDTCYREEYSIVKYTRECWDESISVLEIHDNF